MSDTASAFDELVASSSTAMVVVTASDGTERSGCLVGFHSQASIDPRRYAVWISTANHTHGVARRSPVLAVHFLRGRHHGLARLFGGSTGDRTDKFGRCAWTAGPEGVPLLEDCGDRIVGRVVQVSDVGGDHELFVLEPVVATAVTVDEAPLRLSDVSDIEPGHGS